MISINALLLLLPAIHHSPPYLSSHLILNPLSLHLQPNSVCFSYYSAMTVENGKTKEENTMAVGNGKPEEKTKDNEITVNVTGKAMVLPNGSPADRLSSCPMVTFDLPYITFYYNQKLMVYKLDGDFGSAVLRMKAGLAAALGYFYPLAGRIKQDADGVLYVECEGEGLAGVEAMEAAAGGVTVAELVGGEDGELLQEMVPYTGVMNLEGLRRPLLSVQFTKLKDGLAIGCAFNHAILDGSSTWHFMSSWAELCRGAAASILPFLDRSAARPGVRIPLTLPSSATAHELADPNGPAKPLVAKFFSFPSDVADLIKSQANAALHPDSAKPLSTFQSLGAHIWRAVSRARTLSPGDVTVFAIFADCRARVDPPMPETYFGNLIQAIFTGTAAGLLLANPPAFGAELLQKAIEAHDAGAIKGRLEEYEAAPKLFHYIDAGSNCVAVGSSPRFKVYDVDFGFGRPERVRSGWNNKFDGMVYLYPGREGGRSIDVELTLEREAMERLEKDEEFLMAKKA